MSSSKPVLRTARSSASSFNFQYPVASLRSSSSCLRLLPKYPVTFILPHLSLNNVYQKAVPTPDVTNPVTLPSFYCMYDITLLLSLCNTSPFLTRTAQLIFSILFQHSISKLPTYF